MTTCPKCSSQDVSLASSIYSQGTCVGNNWQCDDCGNQFN